MPTDYTNIDAKGLIFGSTNKDYPNHGQIPVSHGANVVTLIGAGLSGVDRPDNVLETPMYLAWLVFQANYVQEI